MQRGIIVLSKSTNKDRIKENLSIFDFELDGDDMEKIATLDKNESSFFSHRDPKWVKSLVSRKLDV